MMSNRITSNALDPQLVVDHQHPRLHAHKHARNGWPGGCSSQRNLRKSRALSAISVTVGEPRCHTEEEETRGGHELEEDRVVVRGGRYRGGGRRVGGAGH